MSQTVDSDVAEGVLTKRARLKRLLHPRSVAVVGMTDSSPHARTFSRTLQSEVDLYFVHPSAETVFGRVPFRSLRHIETQVDAVFSVVSAARTLSVVEDAIAVGAGGVVAIASGFAELGGEGEALQHELRTTATASGLPVVGPNGIGIVNVPENLDLTMITFERRAGGLSAIAHSGAMLAAMAAPAIRPGGVGFNLLISAGNEAVTDTADYLDFLVEDPGTKVIALMLEQIRRPEPFFAAAARALRAGKPVIAMKMGRGERARRMAASHTGTLTGDSWVYDVAFRQAGIQAVGDIDELIDCVQVLEQLDRSKWSPIDGLAVLTMTGGFAELASDLAEFEHVNVPEAARLEPWVAQHVTGATVPNPLDATSFAGARPDLWEKITEEYAAAPEFDVLLLANQHADWNDKAIPQAHQLVAVARKHGKPSILAPFAGTAGDWLRELRAGDVAVTNGLRPTFKALATMSRFMRMPRTCAVRSPSSVPPIRPPRGTRFEVAEGLMLDFASTMELLANAGIPVASYVVTNGDPPQALSFPDPYVVKLADVAHRTEHGGVRVGVTKDELSSVCDELVLLARDAGLPTNIAVQPMLDCYGEAFIGLNGQSELGPVVAFGPGGVFVEVLNRISGRIAPFSLEDANDLLQEFSDLGILGGLRGGSAWDVEELARILCAAGRLVAGGRAWIESIDINPLMLTDDGIFAVDGLCLLS